MTANLPWTRTPWVDAALLAAHIDPDAVPAESAGVAPHQWFDQLCQAGTLHEAVMFLAHALPRYEAVVWGVQAVLEMGAADRLDPVIVAVLRWVDQPGDALRREAGELAEATRKASPARSLGLAVFYSGGSIAPADYAPVLPPEEACPLLVTGAILAAAEGGDYRARVNQALVRGEAIARGA